MTRIRLKNVDTFRDRNGKSRFYYRRGKGKRIRLPGEPGSAEFLLAYHNAEQDQDAIKCAPRNCESESDSFEWLARQYTASASFNSLREGTAYQRKMAILQLFREEKIGHRPFRAMTPVHLNAMMNRWRPGKARKMLSALSMLMKTAVMLGLRNDNPVREISRPKTREIHTWTRCEIDTYEAYHGLGSAAHDAFALLLYTGQRSGDVRKLEWGNLDGGVIRLKQEKTGADLEIPILPELEKVLRNIRRSPGPILKSKLGSGYSAGGFGQFMKSNIRTAKLPKRCVPHGLRKAAAVRLADAGCTHHEIQAWTGHSTLSQVEKYTRAANQRRLAKAAANRLTSEGLVPDAVRR